MNLHRRVRILMNRPDINLSPLSGLSAAFLGRSGFRETVNPDTRCGRLFGKGVEEMEEKEEEEEDCFPRDPIASERFDGRGDKTLATA